MNDYKQIVDFPDYFININGDIISTKRKNHVFVKGKISNNGYRVVGIRDVNGKRFHVPVHRLVALTFIDNPNNYPVVNHIDGDKMNNSVDNLEWCTISHNTQHAYDNGLCESITKKIILYKNKKIVAKFNTQKDCVEYLQGETGMSFDHIRKVISGAKDKEKSDKLKIYDFVVD